MLDLDKEHLQEHESLRAELDLLRLEVDSISQDMKWLKQCLANLASSQKAMCENNLDKNIITGTGTSTRKTY